MLSVLCSTLRTHIRGWQSWYSVNYTLYQLCEGVKEPDLALRRMVVNVEDI